MKETLLLLAEKIGEERKIKLDSMGTGAAKDYAQYQHACGALMGFMIVQNLISDMLRQVREDGDD